MDPKDSVIMRLTCSKTLLALNLCGKEFANISEKSLQTFRNQYCLLHRLYCMHHTLRFKGGGGPLSWTLHTVSSELNYEKI